VRNKLLYVLIAAGSLLCGAALASDNPAPKGADKAKEKFNGLAETCNNCHGVDGVSAGQSMPSIAGQPENYLKMVMTEWKSGERFSTTMGRLLKGYSDEEIAALANYYAAKPWTPAVQDLNAKLVKNGGFAMERCSKCHGDTGSEPDDDDNETPFLHGQWAKFLELEMLKYRDKAVQLPHEKMRKATIKLEPEEVTAVAAFLAAQKK
jgi:sulfide dehydrogenase cytochrome subunit